LSAIHQRYCAAGVHVVRTNTADTTPQALGRGGYGYRAAKLSSLAVDLAVEAVEGSGRVVAVAGVLPPMEGTDGRLRAEQVAHAQRLMSAGCDVIYVEAAATLRDAVAATAAAAQTDLPVIVALCVAETGNLADGETLDIVCSVLSGAGARGFMAVPSDPTGEIRAIAELSTQGRPWGVLRAASGDMTPTQYAERAAELSQEGATLLGGESYATPEHVRALVMAVPGAERELRRASAFPGSLPPRALSNLPPRM
jgi:methionine synthase I (cobalamin-dependent)